MGALGTAARVLHTTGLRHALSRFGTWQGTLVLTYHRIGDPRRATGDPAAFSATQDQFAAQVRLLARETDVLGPDDLTSVDALTRPGRRTLITFDDGYRDNHDAALPVLRQAGVKALFFVSTGFLDDPDRSAWWDDIAWAVRRRGGDDAQIAHTIATYKALDPATARGFLDDLDHRHPAEDEWLTWDQVRALRDAGMGIGGHTHSHPILARLDPDRQREEVETCRRRLREELDEDMRWFAYPVGTPDAFDADSRRIVRDTGAELAFVLSGGVVEHGTTPDPYAVPRASVVAGMDAARFGATVTLPHLYARW